MQSPTASLGQRIRALEAGAEADFLARFERRVFCLCFARLGERQLAVRWTAALLEEALSALRQPARQPDSQDPMDDSALALFVAAHARARIVNAIKSDQGKSPEPPPSLLRPIELGSFLRGPAFHRAVLDVMQTFDKRILYRWLFQRMSLEETAADLKLDPAELPQHARDAVERALTLVRSEGARPPGE